MLKKFLPSLLIQFGFLLIYVILQDVKLRGLVETGLANKLEAAHLWGGLPLSILFVLAYLKVTNVFERRHHMTLFLVPFLGFFCLYAYGIFPNQDAFHISVREFITLKMKYPGFENLIHMYANWSTSLFVMLVDVWASFIVGVLFWQFMNDTNSVRQAGFLYPLLGLTVAFFLMVSHGISFMVNNLNLPYETYLQRSMLIIGLVGLAILGIHHWLNQRVISRDKEPLPVGHEKLSLGIFEGFGHIFTSRYLMMLAVMVMTFGVILNLMMRLLEHHKFQVMKAGTFCAETYHNVISNLNMASGYLGFLVSVIAAVISIRLLRKKNGWFKVAVVVPIVTGCLSFMLLMSFALQQSATSAMQMFVVISIFTLLLKQAKPFFFKPVKEMAYIPLEAELKVKGKAIIDLAVERFSIALGTPVFTLVFALTQMIRPGADVTIPVISVVMILSIVYFFCIRGISKEYEILIKKR